MGLVNWPTDKSEKTHYDWSWGYNGVTTWNVLVHEQGFRSDDDGWLVQVMRCHMGADSSTILMDDVNKEYTGS